MFNLKEKKKFSLKKTLKEVMGKNIYLIHDVVCLGLVTYKKLNFESFIASQLSGKWIYLEQQIRRNTLKDAGTNRAGMLE